MAAKKTTKRKPRTTLAKLEQELGEIRQFGIDHAAGDDKVHADTNRRMMTLVTKDDLSVVAVEMASKKDLTLLATKEDVAAMLEMFKNLTMAAKIIKGGGSWSWRILFGAAAVIAVIGVIKGGWLAAVHYVYSLASGN